MLWEGGLKTGWSMVNTPSLLLNTGSFIKDTHLSSHRITFLLLYSNFSSQSFSVFSLRVRFYRSWCWQCGVAQMSAESEAAWISVSLVGLHFYLSICQSHVQVCVCVCSDDEDERGTWRHMSTLAVKCVCVTSFCLLLVSISPSSLLLMTPDRLMTDKECVSACVFGRGPQKARNQTALKLALHNYILTRA